LDLIFRERVTEVSTDVEIVDEENLELLDARLPQALELLRRDLLVALEKNLARLTIDDVVRRDLADELLDVDRKPIELRLAKLLDRRARKLGVPTNDRLRADADVARRALTQQQIVLDRLRVLVAVLEVDRLR